MLSRYADDAYARALRRRPDDDVRLEARVGRLHTNSPPATRFAASPALPVSVSARPVSSPALNASPSGGESGASGGSGGSEGRCESSMICRTRSTCVSAVVVDPPSSTSSARVRPSLRARSNGRNDPRPSVLATAPASADASVCSRLGRTTPADARVSRPTVDGIGAPRDPPRELQTSNARIATARGPSAAFGTRVPPRVGLLLRCGARKSPRDADAGGPTPMRVVSDARLACVDFFHAVARVHVRRSREKNDSSPVACVSILRRSSFSRRATRALRSPAVVDERLEERLRGRVRRDP